VRVLGAAGKQNVAIMKAWTSLEYIEKRETSNECRYYKAKVLSNHKSEEINESVKEMIDDKSIFITDQST
jgi:hypothetical protein